MQSLTEETVVVMTEETPVEETVVTTPVEKQLLQLLQQKEVTTDYVNA